MLGWKLLWSRVSGKRRSLICPGESQSQLPLPNAPQYGGSLDPDPEILIHAHLGLDATFFFRKLSIYLEIGAFAVCLFFWNNSVCLFIYVAERRSRSIWTSKNTPNLTVPLEDFHFLTVHGDGAFTDGVWVSLFSLFISLFVFLCVRKLTTWQAAQYL